MRLLDDTRRALFVHAHPDDETLATGALIADLVARGVEVHVVTATRGERGELRPGVADVRPGSPEYVAVREGELANALVALGVTHHAFLGMPPARHRAAAGERSYRDSGMRWIRPGVAGPALTEGVDEHGHGHGHGDGKGCGNGKGCAGGNRHGVGQSFTAATLSEAVADLAAYVEATGPDVVISYDSGGGYGHPDHVRTREVSEAVARSYGIRLLEVIPPDREVDGDPSLVEWAEMTNRVARVQDALRAHATQVQVDGGEVVHVGGQREPIVTRVGLRQVFPEA